ncbi:hypothetical protein lerEdw1_010850 [Lerista edwardsae]|nr:hypothetical protein lerEdw1_010850 [Lerista edwardsae]
MVSSFFHSPSSSSRFGSSCNVSQGSSHLSELDLCPGSGPDSEREDEPLGVPSTAPAPLLREAPGFLPEPLERERLVEGEPEAKEPTGLEWPPEAEAPREAATGPPGGPPEEDASPLPFAPARARWIRAINQVRLQFREVGCSGAAPLSPPPPACEFCPVFA